jgi:hypothetical protein
MVVLPAYAHRRKRMGTFTIQPHGRLPEWMAGEKGDIRE